MVEGVRIELIQTPVPPKQAKMLTPKKKNESASHILKHLNGQQRSYTDDT
jgi:hypothetical protein